MKRSTMPTAEEPMAKLPTTLTGWQLLCWTIADEHGFHEPGTNDNMAAWVANLHGEVSELWEAYRADTLRETCEKDARIDNAEEELADIIIRTLDIAGQMGINIERAMRIKCEYNMGRPYLHGGKKA